MRTPIALSLAVLALAATGCGGAQARLQFDNQSAALQSRPPPDGVLAQALLADGTSLRIKMIAVYLAEDVDPTTQDNLGNTSMIWLNPQCAGDIEGCNVEGMDWAAGPRVTDFFDFARSSAEVNAGLNAQGATVSAGTYRYARVEFCKSRNSQAMPTRPTLMWKAPGMSAEESFASADCGRTSLAFSPPLQLAAGDSVEVTLGYDLDKAVAAGPTAPGSPRCPYTVAGHLDAGGQPHCYRTCVDLDATNHACMDFPDFVPSAQKN